MDPTEAQRERFREAGATLFVKFQQEGNPTALSEAIFNLQKALDLCPPGHPDRPNYLNNLAIATLIRDDRQGDINDLTLAIQYQQEWLDLHPLGHSKANRLYILANTIMTRYKREGNLEDLTRAAQYYQDALDLRPPGQFDRSACLNSLGNAFQTRCDRGGNLADLNLAIQCHEEALGLRPSGHPDRPDSLNNLAHAVWARYNREENPDDLTLAIQYHEEALGLRPPGHPDRPIFLNNLARVIQTRYEQDGNLEDLNRAVQYHEEALDLCPPGHPQRPASLNNLAHAICIRYNREGNSDDLTRAIQYREELLGLRPPGHPDRSASLDNLASAIRTRYERDGNLDDLTRALQYLKEALDLLPLEHPNRSAFLNNMANAIWTRYNREGNLDDLTRAIQYHEEALDLHPPGHPNRSIFLNDLANAIQTRYERDGNLEDLTLAIQYHEEALGLRPPGHPDRSIFLSNLASAIQTRYERDGKLEDLTRAVQYHEEALDLRPTGHPERSDSLNNLANTIQTRYNREGNLADLNLAIQYHEEALGLRPPGHPDRPDSLNNLAHAVWARYNREENLDDLTCALNYHREALDLCPPGHPRRSDCLHYLAIALYAQYSRTQSVGQSVNSTSLDLRADTLKPLEHVDRPSSKCDSRALSRSRIIYLLKEASQSASCSPRDCLWAALDWVEIAKDLEPDSTLAAYTSALHQLDTLLALGQSIKQRHDRLRFDEIFAKTKNLGVEAATWALRHDDPPRAVELLEQGRGLLLAQIGRYRAELGDLRLVDTELADRFARLSRHLDALIVSNQKLEEGDAAIKDPYERYRQASKEWTRAVEEIQALEGFETFLKPTPYEQLRLAAVEGPVIILIPGNAGTAVLIIRSDAPIHPIDLPNATADRLSEISNNFTDALTIEDYNDIQRDQKCVDNLAFLWNEVVGPITQALQNELGIPLRSRVWWCPTSIACFLPLHAAGLYSKKKAGENFPNKYISSYTSTLQALLRARRSKSTLPKKLLVISQPHTPGEPPLPYARDEADTIAKIMSSAGTELLPTMTLLLSEAGTREAVQREMLSHSWVHFICHGVQKASQPLDSYLSLHDGPLTLHKIIKQDIPNADFAFLAACHSAAGDKDLANEALHLGAAMQFAGFRGVVGTLWKMRDVDGPPLAEAFYQDMAKRGDHHRAAVALSNAINYLRRNKVPIHRWIRFIHIGA